MKKFEEKHPYWQFPPLRQERKRQGSSEVHLHYTGKELTAFEDTDKYTVVDGKKTGTGNYYAIPELKDTNKYEWESTNSSTTPSHRKFLVTVRKSKLKEQLSKKDNIADK